MGGGRYRRPQTCLAASIRSNTIERYTDCAPLPRNVALPAHTQPLQNADLAALGTSSLNFKSIASTKAQAPYWSPAAENIGTPDADRIVLRERLAEDKLRDVSAAWWGWFAQVEHNIILRRSPTTKNQTHNGSWACGTTRIADASCGRSKSWT